MASRQAIQKSVAVLGVSWPLEVKRLLENRGIPDPNNPEKLVFGWLDVLERRLREVDDRDLIVGVTLLEDRQPQPNQNVPLALLEAAEEARKQRAGREAQERHVKLLEVETQERRELAEAMAAAGLDPKLRAIVERVAKRSEDRTREAGGFGE